MKQFEVYRNIRKGAVIFGLPISSFALMMICVVASLLVIIFSFSFWIIISALILNCILYLVLIRITRTSQLFQVSVKFPEIISNRRNSNFNYEQD
ncbi:MULTISPECIES: hypothetical protein [Salinimicrobium]|uniref:Uncharacterized protein n=2 Tax=Salinimicrobium TaxID=561367 RepID=A0A9X3CZB4_9FLAO|nr:MULTISPECIES: hypothetical protein [Salinimicrobium]MCX2838419.1 hypothetical protein [Salinimicrobium profundisediminis]NJW52183.1 hypothetical protein [Salinimicrobium oceani]